MENINNSNRKEKYQLEDISKIQNSNEQILKKENEFKIKKKNKKILKNKKLKKTEKG